MNLTVRDEALRQALRAAPPLALDTTIDVGVELARAPEGGEEARVLLARTEPRALWQTALSLQANLRTHGLGATVGVARNDQSVEPLRLTLALHQMPDAAGLEPLLRAVLAPVIARPVPPPPPPPPSRRLLPVAHFEVVRAPAPEPQEAPAAVAQEAPAETPPEGQRGRKPRAGEALAEAHADRSPAGALPAAAPAPEVQTQAESSAPGPVPAPRLRPAFPEARRPGPPDPPARPALLRQSPPPAEPVVGEILSVRAQPAGEPGRGVPAPAPPASPGQASGESPTRDDTPQAQTAREESRVQHPDGHREPPAAEAGTPASAAAADGAATPLSAEAPWGPPAPSSGGVQTFPRPTPRPGAVGPRPGAPPAPPSSRLSGRRVPSAPQPSAGAAIRPTPPPASTLLRPPAPGQGGVAGARNSGPPATWQAPPRRTVATSAARRLG